MSSICYPVPALLLLAGALAAADTPTQVPRGGTTALDGGNGLAPITDFGAGRAAAGAARQVVVQGLIDLDVLQRNNYTDSNKDGSDHRGYGTMRAELGLKIKMDERATAVIGFGYNADMGDYGVTNTRPGVVAPPSNESQINSEKSQLVLKDAYVNLKEFLGFEELGVIAGRTPVSWNMVADRGAFMFDSRADDPAIGSWDGVRASYSGFDVMVISPWIYRLPDASTIFGATLDWKPATADGDKVFVTLNASEQVEPVVGGVRKGDNLRTYGGGIDWRSGETGLWLEVGFQQGDAGSDASFGGYGGETGLDWQFSQYGKGRLQLIAGYMTGDDPATTDVEGFVNEWESISDTLIVENEKYGELSRLTVGNLESLKFRIGTGFDERDKVRIDSTLAYYRLSEAVVTDGSRSFGTELDLTLRWQYTYNAQIRLFGGLLKPGDGLGDAQEIAKPGTITGNDLIWLGGANINVAF